MSTAAPPKVQATKERIQVAEAIEKQSIKAVEGRATKREIKLIDAGWGSSGYYAKEMLARCGPICWPAGTHMYLNHPSMTEEVEQPERRVEDLAAVLLTDPVMQGNGLYAEAEIFDHHAPVINAIADHIGVSIRAIGEHEMGEAEGREGIIITNLIEGISVDFVTHAGRGGEVGMLIESARKAAVDSMVEEARNLGNWLEAKIHREFTWIADDMFADGYVSREERIGLSSALGEALNAFNAEVASSLPHLYNRDPYAGPSEESGEDVEEKRTKAAPAARPKEAQVADEDKELSEIRESVSKLETRVSEVETERDTEKEARERAEDALALERAKNVVKDVLDGETEVEEGADAIPELPTRARERVIEAATKGELPVDENGKLDHDKLTESAIKAIRAEADYLNGASNAGTVTGVGVAESVGGGSNGGTPKDGDKDQLKERFKRIGMSDEAATIAAEGR